MYFIIKILTLIGLTAYIAVAQAETDRQLLIEQCQACHSPREISTHPQFPQLAAQNEDYLYKQLSDFAQGTAGGRNNGIMTGIAASLTPHERLSLAAYFSQQDLQPGRAEAKYIKRGQQLYRGGDKEQGIPACSACHGPTGAGNPLAKFPLLSGQSPLYTINQLHAFKQQHRRNDSNQIMRNISAKLSDEDMIAVASYITGLHGKGD